MRKFKICLIEDDPAFMYLARLIVQTVDNTADILSFDDGSQAFKFLEKNKTDFSSLPDVIFLDLNMPYMDGWAFLDAYDTIKNDFSKTIPIYILSSSISESDISRAASNPLVVEFMSKPFEEQKLAEILSSLP